MHLIEEITVTIKGLASKPANFTLPKHMGRELLAYIESCQSNGVPAAEVLPELADPRLCAAAVLRGLRYREKLTQKELAERLGIRQHHLSEMENAKRPIGKEMAKKLGAASGTHWKLFF